MPASTLCSSVCDLAVYLNAGYCLPRILCRPIRNNASVYSAALFVTWLFAHTCGIGCLVVASAVIHLTGLGHNACWCTAFSVHPPDPLFGGLSRLRSSVLSSRLRSSALSSASGGSVPRPFRGLSRLRSPALSAAFRGSLLGPFAAAPLGSLPLCDENEAFQI